MVERRRFAGTPTEPTVTKKADTTDASVMDATTLSTGAPVETPAELIPFNDAIREAKQILANESKGQWRLGELADKVEPIYNESTLEKFAETIGIPFKTVERHRDVWRAWKDFPAPGRELPSYSVARALAAVPDRADFVTDNPHMSKREAEEIAKEYRDQQKKSAANDEGNKKKSGRARTYANQLIEVLEDVDVTPWGQQPGLAFIFVRVAAAAAKAAATLEPSQADLLLPIAAAAAKAADALEALEKPNQADPKSAKPSKKAA
jgi:hypothetical protein